MDLKEQWQQAPFWQKLALVILLSGAVVFVAYTLAVEPKKQEYESLKSEVENLESQLETLKVSTDRKMVEKLNLKIKQVDRENQEKFYKIKQYSRSIPSEPEIQKVLYFISTSAKTSGMKLTNFKVEKEEDVKLYYDKNEGKLKAFQTDEKNKEQKEPENLVKLKKVYIQTSLTGDFKGIFRFVDLFSGYERLTNIEKIDIKREPSKLNYTISISVYYSPEDNQL